MSGDIFYYGALSWGSGFYLVAHSATLGAFVQAEEPVWC